MAGCTEVVLKPFQKQIQFELKIKIIKLPGGLDVIF